MAFENPGGSRDPSLAWNPATDQFGLGFTGWSGNAAFAGFRRIGADGSVSGRQTFGFTAGTFTTGIEVNSSGQYVLAYALHPGTRTATFDAGGGMMAENFITSRFGHDQSLGLAYNPSTGSFLAVGSDGASLEVAGAEVNGGGGPNSGGQILTEGAGHGSFHPLTTARPGSNQWDVVYSRDFRGATNQIVASASSGGGGAPAPPPPAPTPPPPPPPDSGTGGGVTTPTPTTTGCTTPDPFLSLGGGTCVNGGWWPPGMGGTPSTPTTPTAPTSPPPTGGGGGGGTTVGCTTADPFVSLGGGTCWNGGWFPPGMAVPSTPTAPPTTPTTPTTPTAPSPTGDGSCTTSDPFVSIGGGICSQGGWRPRGAPVP